MQVHELKTWPMPYEAVNTGRKTHEVRKADRPFKAGDWLRLREYRPGVGYTGRELNVEVTYVTDGGEWGLPTDICVLSIRKVQP